MNQFTPARLVTHDSTTEALIYMEQIYVLLLQSKPRAFRVNTVMGE